MYPSKVKHLKDLWTEYWIKSPYDQFDLFLARAFKKRPFMGKRDRAGYSEQLYFILRNGIKFLNLAPTDSLFSDPQQFAMYLADLPEEFFIRMEEYSKTPSTPVDSKDDLLRLNWHPDWIEKIENSNLNAKSLEKLGQRAPLWLRARSESDLEKVKAELIKRQWAFQSSGLSLKLESNLKLHELPSFNEGAFEVQDWASQQVSLMASLHGNEIVWDACAGGGGKTLHLASLLANSGTVYASDVRSYKLDEIKRRVARAHLKNIEYLLWDGRPQLPLFPKQLLDNGGFDLVLVDAPCSGSGTVRRHPEIKWQSPMLKLNNLLEKQKHILAAVEKSLKTGGFLLYATCSFLKDENEDLIKKFLNEHDSSWKLVKQSTFGLSAEEDSDILYACLMQKLK